MLRAVLSTALLAVSLPLFSLQAAPSACPGHYLNGQPPVAAKAAVAERVQELCNAAFANGHLAVRANGQTSAVSPLWAAERLNKENIAAGAKVDRRNDFRPDDRLDPKARATLNSFKGSGYDRGHLAPSADMPTAAADSESFLLSNMVPQVPDHNQKLWSAVEDAVRNLARAHGEVYVVTGPIFDGAVKTLPGQVMVPSRLYKAVYVPGKGAAAYLSPNDATRTLDVVSIQDLEAQALVNVFPGLPAAAKNKAIALPDVVVKDRGGAKPAGAPKPVAQATETVPKTAAQAADTPAPKPAAANTETPSWTAWLVSLWKWVLKIFF